MTRREKIYALKQQKKELLDRMAWLEKNSSEYGGELDKLRDVFIQQRVQVNQLQEFTDFCESIPEKIKGRLIDGGLTAVAGSFAYLFLFKGSSSAALTVAPVYVVLSTMIKLPYNYFYLKREAMIGDLSDFEMEQYDINERKKGVFYARESMIHEALDCKYQLRDMNSEIDAAVKGKVR